VCPGCQSAMQTLKAGEIELERCFFCGGVYLDAGELEKVAGHPVDLGPDGDGGARICPSCGTTLEPAQAGRVLVDHCPGCGGIYLDAGELERLAGEVALTPAEAPAASEKLTFRCPGCGETFDADLGVTTAYGLACAACAPGLELGNNVLTGTGRMPPVSCQPGDPGTRELQVLSGVLGFLGLFLGF
jgi:Zn-finger nucleic acid-binding protein